MKKYFLAVIVAASVLCLAGCREEEPVVEVPETVAEEEPTEEVSEEVISVEGAVQLVDIAKLSEDDYYDLDLEVFAESLKVQDPDWRSDFGVSADKEMAQEDWQEIKDLLFYTRYGETVYAYLSRTGKGPQIVEEPEEVADISDDYGGYNITSATKEYVDSLSAKEFYEWMSYVTAYANNGTMLVLVPSEKTTFTEKIPMIDYWEYMPEEYSDEVATKQGLEPGTAFREKVTQQYIDAGVIIP